MTWGEIIVTGFCVFLALLAVLALADIVVGAWRRFRRGGRA